MKVNLSLDSKDHTVRAEVNLNNENYVKKASVNSGESPGVPNNGNIDWFSKNETEKNKATFLTRMSF